jgi:protein-S-isoprenylcysteine O-methyltransferase Ste14
MTEVASDSSSSVAAFACVAMVLVLALTLAVRLLARGTTVDDVHACGRAAATGAWWIFVVIYLGPSGCELDDNAASRGALTSAIVGFVVALLGRRWPQPSDRRVVALLVGVSTVAVVVGEATTGRVGFALVVGAAAALFSVVAPMRGVHPRWRFAWHLASLFGWLVVAGPLVASSPPPLRWQEALPLLGHLESALPLSLGVRWGLALALVVGGAGLLGASASSLMREGGTPDPSDPPLALCTTGPYRLCRHPMLVAQSAIVVGACFAWGSVGALLWAGGFVVVAVAVVSPRDDRVLVARFGDAAVAYQGRVGFTRPRQTSA